MAVKQNVRGQITHGRSGCFAAVTSESIVALEVASKEPAADAVITVTLRAASGARLPDWTPGSHIDLMLGDMTRQYSLCGDRWDPFSYTIGVLREPDGRGGSQFVHDILAIGDRVDVGGPRNNFPLVPASRYLFIAGGIGITPLISMIDQAEFLGIDWQLLYVGRRRGSMAFAEALDRYGERVVIVATDEAGRPDLGATLRSAEPGTRIYCCGPASLLASVEGHCAHLPPNSLRTERFVGEVGAATRTSAFEVELARTGCTIRVAPGQSVLDAITAAGVTTLSSCRQGVCGTCETAVLAGRPDHRDSILSERERAGGHCMLVCVSRSLDDRLVLDI